MANSDQSLFFVGALVGVALGAPVGMCQAGLLVGNNAPVAVEDVPRWTPIQACVDVCTPYDSQLVQSVEWELTPAWPGPPTFCACQNGTGGMWTLRDMRRSLKYYAEKGTP